MTPKNKHKIFLLNIIRLMMYYLYHACGVQLFYTSNRRVNLTLIISNVVTLSYMFIGRCHYSNNFMPLSPSQTTKQCDKDSSRLSFHHFYIPNYACLYSLFHPLITFVFSLQKHYPDDPEYNFHHHVVQTLAVDFKKVIGVR